MRLMPTILVNIVSGVFVLEIPLVVKLNCLGALTEILLAGELIR